MVNEDNLSDIIFFNSLYVHSKMQILNLLGLSDAQKNDTFKYSYTYSTYYYTTTTTIYIGNGAVENEE